MTAVIATERHQAAVASINAKKAEADIQHQAELVSAFARFQEDMNQCDQGGYEAIYEAAPNSPARANPLYEGGSVGRPRAGRPSLDGNARKKSRVSGGGTASAATASAATATASATADDVDDVDVDVDVDVDADAGADDEKA